MSSLKQEARPDIFEGREWGRFRYEALEKPVALLHPEERKLMAWMAANVYTGEGEIIDAGAFLGGSALCFAEGLSRNGTVTRKDGRIHSYDLFRKGDWLQSPLPVWDDLPARHSSLHVFHDQLGDKIAMSSVYPGNILERTWDGRPIEICMLDCSKTQALHDHVLRMFLPSMISGRSYLLHQDYGIRSSLYWLHITQYLLRDHFDHIATVVFGGTTLFRCTKPISRETVERVIAEQDQDPARMRDACLGYHRELGDEKLVAAVESSFRPLMR